MADQPLDASGFIAAPIELVRELVQEYVKAGYDMDAMRHVAALALSCLVERTLIAKLTQAEYVRISGCSLTLDQADQRITALQSLPLL